MKIYALACETIENGGGIYSYNLTENGSLQQTGYFSCDRPMYAVKCKRGLCVLLCQPFADDNVSGYFYVDENLQNASEIKSSRGVVACHLCVDNDNVYIVNYLSGNIVKNGEIIAQRRGSSIHPKRQTEPHTHFVNKTPNEYFAVCDLGTDALAFYDKDLQFISETKVPEGYGIRHLVFSEDGKYIYAINELIPSISIFAYQDGRARLIDTVKILCKNEKANGAAIRLSEDGKYLYVSLRVENVICVYAVDNEKLTHMQTIDCSGDSPRDFNIFENKLICTNEKSDSVTCFDLENGLLKELRSEIKIQKALCVL